MVYHVDFITDFIFFESCITPCDVILVPGGSHPQLAQKAAELFHEGMEKYIIFSGRSNISTIKFTITNDIDGNSAYTNLFVIA